MDTGKCFDSIFGFLTFENFQVPIFRFKAPLEHKLIRKTEFKMVDLQDLQEFLEILKTRYFGHH